MSFSQQLELKIISLPKRHKGGKEVITLVGIVYSLEAPVESFDILPCAIE